MTTPSSERSRSLPSLPSLPSTAELDQTYERLKNWGRWGAGDQRGALNHQTAEHRRAAASLVTHGLSLSMAHDLPVMPSAESPFPAQHHMLTSGDSRDSTGIPGYEACGDYVGTQVHGLGLTHIDALCHMFVRGEMYNGIPASEVRADGARANTIMSVSDGLVGRGVLFDIPALRGCEFLAADDLVTVDDLHAAEAAQGLRVGTGDFLVISTGRDVRRRQHHGQLSPFGEGLPGLHPECLTFLHGREISVLGSDGISDRMPFHTIADWPFPIHQIGITGIGLHLIDNLHLETLAAACRDRGRYEFQMLVASLRIPGGTGCPVNPIAVL